MTTSVRAHSRISCMLAGPFALALASAATGCGGSKPQAEDASTAPSDVRAPPPDFYEVSMPQEADEETESATEPPKPEAPKQSEPEKTVRRPQPTFNNEQEIATTIGEGGAVMKLGNVAILRIPEGALRDGVNIRFALATSTPDKAAPARLGQSVALEPKLKSAGPAFEITFALPEGASAVDLVVPVASTQKGVKKSEYKLVSSKQVDAKKKQALFDLAELPGADVYLTKRAQPAAANAPTPTQAPAAPGSAGATSPASGKK